MPQPEAMADFFDARHRGYDEHMAQSVARFEQFYCSIAQPLPETDLPVRILDIGCGTGLELKPIWDRAPGALITGIDVSWAMLGRLRETYPGYRDQLRLIQGSYLELPLGKGMYDFAVAVMTLHHLLPERKKELYGRISSALKMDGIYVEGDWVVSTAEEHRYLRAFEERLVEWPDAEHGGYHLDVPLSLDHQRHLLLTAGFESVNVIWQAKGNGVYVARKESESPE